MKRIYKNLSSFIRQSSSKGFTLIELLVVIGILGVLAAALVATIDPFEQLKKAQDANTKNTTVEFVNANIRYYTTHTAMPWNNSVSNCTLTNGATNSLTDSAVNGCLAALVEDGELKAGFTSITNTLGQIFISGGDNNVIACFNPKSRAENHNSYTKYDALGAVATGCPTTSTVSTSCFWCAQ